MYVFVLSLARAGLGPCVRYWVLTLSPWHPDSGPSFHPRGILILSLHILILNPWLHRLREDGPVTLFWKNFLELSLKGSSWKFLEACTSSQCKSNQVKSFEGKGRLVGEKEFYLVTDPVTRGDVTKGNIHHITHHTQHHIVSRHILSLRDTLSVMRRYWIR